MSAEPPPASRQTFAALASALPPLFVSFQLFRVLQAPLAGTNRQWAADAWLLMATEFFLMHAGVLSGAFALVLGPTHRVAFMALLTGFYGLFMFGLWRVTDGSWIVTAAALLLAGRLVGAALGGQQVLQERLRASLISALLFFVLIVITTAPMHFPMSAFTPEVLEQLRSASGGGEGRWVREPQRPLTLGAFYFLVLGLIELWRPLKRWLVP